MPDTKISELPAMTGEEASLLDTIPIVDVSTTTTKKITREEFFKSVDYISFDTVNAVSAPAEGQLTWDTTDKTLSLGLDGGQCVLQIGQEAYFRVRNNTGSTITNGTVCRFAGSIGNSGTILAAPFQANGVYNSNVIIGVATEDIPNGSDGLVTHFGKVRGINTSAFTDGQPVYASSTVLGGLTATRPDAPNNVVSIGFVVSAANNGTLFVRPHKEDIWQAVPATATSAGQKGDNAFDDNYFYVCVATNTWKRVALNTW